MYSSPYFEKLGGEFDIRYKDNDQPHKHIFHIHNELEVMLLLSEGISVLIGEEQTMVPAGSVLLFNSMDLHRMRIPEDGDYRRYVLWLSPEFLSCFTQGQEYMLSCFFYRPFPHPQILPLAPEALARVRTLMDTLIQARHSQEYGHDLLERLLVAQLLISINRSYLHFHGIQTDPGMQQYGAIFHCIPYIHAHLDEELGLEELAARVYISRRRLIDQFREVTGMTPGHYILNCRMMKARACLAQGMSVDETCAKAGFGNLSHFIRIFKKYQGITPKQYMLHYSEKPPDL